MYVHAAVLPQVNKCLYTKAGHSISSLYIRIRCLHGQTPSSFRAGALYRFQYISAPHRTSYQELSTILIYTESDKPVLREIVISNTLLSHLAPARELPLA